MTVDTRSHLVLRLGDGSTIPVHGDHVCMPPSRATVRWATGLSWRCSCRALYQLSGGAGHGWHSMRRVR